jgi:hypothetical protein
MRPLVHCTILTVALVALSGCGSKSSKTAEGQPDAAAQAPAGAAAPAPQPGQPPADQAAQQPAQQGAAPAPAPVPAPPPPPPEPIKHVVAAGTPISVRTVAQVSTKTAQSGNQFEATLENALVVDGYTIAKRGASAIGTVAAADQGGRVKGKASLTVTLSKLHLANGKTVSVRTNSVTQEAKSDTKKNLVRTGIMSGAGAAIGAIAGGGKGAAIGAGIGGGAGVATNLATKGPAADLPPETQLNFQLASDLVVMEQPKAQQPQQPQQPPQPQQP